MSKTDIVAFESASKQSLQLGSLVEATCETLQVLEPWSGAIAKHPSTVSIVNRVKEQAVVFYGALDLSIQTAQKGYAFTSDALILCDFLLDAKCSVEDLAACITRMRHIAQDAHVDVVHQSNLFRMVRRKLFAITMDIPVEVSKLQEEKQSAEKQKRRFLKQSNQVKLCKAVADTGSIVLTASIALGITAPVLLILPVILPIVSLVCGELQTQYVKKAHEREMEARDAGDAIKQLRQVAVDIASLVEHVDLFASWWSIMDTMLDVLESQIAQLHEETGASASRVDSIKSNWQTVKEMSVEYMIKVNRLQDYYPSSITASDASKRQIP